MQYIVNHAAMENLRHSNQLFPISEFIDQFDLFPQGSFPIHWHPELELQIILKGSAEYTINGETYLVSEGSAIYIGPESVHSGKALSDHTVGYDVVLLPQFLISLMQTALCEHLAIPLTTHQPAAQVIMPESKEGNVILESLKRLYYTESSHYGYELFLTENLLAIWRNLITIFPKNSRHSYDNGKLLREQRMKDMLEYIKKNYPNAISMTDIAASANISKSECFRCFAEMSQLTPIEYVNQYRLTQAALLLRTTTQSISDICYLTGFNSSSYFTKKFKNHYKMTPRAYRNQHMVHN
ncbi:AraC family transcriptional regulator [Agathobaculum desmolans]|uniref:AraC family transcriptional regulator n=1 Tax=Agathobaculum desmolans TaxID=39484 RepID=UPI00068FF69C|nr:AraC family transcriptional regulator [Agathobaculum desmolans]